MSKFIYCQNEWGGTKAFHLEGLVFSKTFCYFFSDKFTDIFMKETGLKPSTKVTLAGYKQPNDLPIYEPGSVSKLNLVLWIMPEYNDNISFCWKSKTGRVVKPTDENFDEQDLECWIEGLNPGEYWKQVATEKKTHPFQIANLPFDLNVFDFGIEMEMRIYGESGYEKIKDDISKTIRKYNNDSEAINRKNGVVHNYKFIHEACYLCLRIDTGSAGIEITKKVLKVLTKLSKIEKIEIDI